MMPDLINSELTNGKTEFIRWADELCSSCKEANCPLLMALSKYKIMTFSGIHVSDCMLYDPDVESEYYIPPDADQSRINEANAMVAKQGITALQKLMDTISADEAA